MEKACSKAECAQPHHQHIRMHERTEGSESVAGRACAIVDVEGDILAPAEPHVRASYPREDMDVPRLPWRLLPKHALQAALHLRITLHTEAMAAGLRDIHIAPSHVHGDVRYR
jgi:hypothetical protein